MKPQVSVILPVFNQEKFLDETIESIITQSFEDFELMIMDDGSTDNSAEIIRRYMVKDARIQAFFDTNSGKSAATNFLVGKARGEWCAFLDADDVMLPGRLERQVEFHEENPGVHVTSSHCYYINEHGNMFGIQRYPGLTTIEEFKETTSKEDFITCAFTGLMVSTKVFTESGGLMSQFEPCEDFEFFNRLTDKGFVLLIIPEILMKYRIHAAAVTVLKPILVRDTINYVIHCIKLRRSGLPDISRKEFMAVQDSYSWWVKLNRKRFNYSIIMFRSAGVEILSKRYGSFVWKIFTSILLSPNYVLKKVRNHLKM